MDTVHGKSKGKKQTVLVLTERKTRYEILLKLNSCSTSNVIKALQKARINNRLFKTITVDIGSEFSEKLATTLSNQYHIPLYYCHPFTSCERGSNERNNRIFRRFYPKGKSLNKVTNKDLKRIQDYMNNLPRKILNWQTAREQFIACCAAENIPLNFSP